MPFKKSRLVYNSLLEKYKNNVSSIIDAEEFKDETLRFKFVFKILRRYKNSGQLNVRLLLNHLIILHNVFEDLATTILIEGIDEDLQEYLFASLAVLSRLPSEHSNNIDIETYQLIQREIERA